MALATGTGISGILRDWIRSHTRPPRPELKRILSTNFQTLVEFAPTEDSALPPSQEFFPGGLSLWALDSTVTASERWLVEGNTRQRTLYREIDPSLYPPLYRDRTGEEARAHLASTNRGATVVQAYTVTLPQRQIVWVFDNSKPISGRCQAWRMSWVNTDQGPRYLSDNSIRADGLGRDLTTRCSCSPQLSLALFELLACLEKVESDTITELVQVRCLIVFSATVVDVHMSCPKRASLRHQQPLSLTHGRRLHLLPLLDALTSHKSHINHINGQVLHDESQVMTTSITDARFTSLHFTAGHLASISFDEPPETGWGVMPGYDESLPVPAYLEPPRLDADETLPSQIHPSYPFGRPASMSRPQRPWMSGPTNLLGTVGQGTKAGDAALPHLSSWGGEAWDELGLEQVVEAEETREVPPGMAGAKRPPSPPSPALHPTAAPAVRSHHLQRLYERQRQTTPTAPADPFDAPVPNETYAEEDVQQQTAAARGEATGQVGGAAQAVEDDDGDEQMADGTGDMGA